MAISELIEQGLTREQAIELAVSQLNMTEGVARFTLAVELGELSGDLEPLDEDDDAKAQAQG